MTPISNIVYQRQYATKFLILDLQENIYKKVKKPYYVSAGFAARHVVGFEALTIDVFLDVENFQGRHFLRKKNACGNANTPHRGWGGGGYWGIGVLGIREGVLGEKIIN